MENKRYECDLNGQMTYNEQRDAAKQAEEDRMYEEQKAAEDEYYCKLEAALANPDDAFMHPIGKFERAKSSRPRSNTSIIE